MTTFLSSKAQRPKNAWFVYCARVEDTYELNLGYKSTKGSVGPYSNSKQNAAVKIPWGPFWECEYRVRKDNGEPVKEFKFCNSRKEVVACNETLLNNLEQNVNPFSQKITELAVGNKKKLLANYWSVTQTCKGFVHHNGDVHEDTGIRKDGEGVTQAVIEENGGSLAELIDFVKDVKESAVFGDAFQVSTAKRKNNSGDGAGSKPKKMNTKALIDNNEKLELEDPEGMEKKFQRCYRGLARIPLDDISESKELNIKPNVYRVCIVGQSMKAKYDPAQAIVVVAPADDGQDLDLENLNGRKFVVVQKVHTLLALKDLDKKGEFSKLTGHDDRKVTCYVVNTKSVALLRYGYQRSNDIASSFSKKTHPQDLLHVFETLSAKDNSLNCIKVVDRMGKLGRLGPNEATAVRKICKWSPDAFKCLMDVLKKFEVYQTLDVKKSGNAGRLSRGEKLAMPNTVFNELAKVDEKFFVENHQQVISKKISLRNLVYGSEMDKELRNAYSVLMQISGYKTYEALDQEFPGKFDENIMERFIGAEIQGEKKNIKATLLDDYFLDVKLGLDSGDFPVSFVEFDSVEDGKILDAVDRVDVFVMIMKKGNPEVGAAVIKRILQTEKMIHIGVFLFSSELACFEALSFLRSHNTALVQNFNIIPVGIFNEKAPALDGVQDNLYHGIIFGKMVILKPPLKMYYSNFNMLSDILESIALPQSDVAVVAEPGVSMIQVHTEQLLFKVQYHGSKEEITKFKKILDNDKQMFTITRPKATLSHTDGESSTSQEKIVDTEESSGESGGESCNESSTSPFKSPASSGALNSTQDSGIGSPSPRSLVFSSKKSSSKHLKYDYGETIEDIEALLE